MVSVLIPVYNAEKTINRCLDSILCQTCQDIELIIVNDGSTDNTLSICLKYAEKDKRVIIYNQPNQGVSAARNKGLRNASGDFILYVDADDWIEPNMIQRMVGLIEDADIVFCGNDHSETPGQVECIDDAKIEYWNQQQQMLEFMKHKRMTGMLWNKLIRRNITEDSWFNEKTGYGEDAEFLWKILKKSHKMVVMNEILYHHVLDDTSISHLSFSDKKYSAIPMWESITEEVERDYPELLSLAKERLMCATVYSGYEMKKAGYKNEVQKRHIQEIVKKNWKEFIKSDTVSSKMKIYATVIGFGVGKVSVIIPIYNTEKYLVKCLESIRTQTYSDIEVIMVDDGSADGSKNVANSYAERDNRFRLFSQENAGVSSARNRGLDVAEGEYILFADSDDWLEPQMIEKLVYNMIEYSTDVSCCQYDRSTCFTGETTEIWNRDIALQNFLVHKQINGSLVNKLFKKGLIDSERLDESIKYGEDALFFWKNLLVIRSIAVSPDVLYHVTLHDDSASGGGSYKPIRRDCIRVWKLISQDAVQVSVELGRMARAQLGNMAFFSLYEMGYYGCKNEEHQKEYLNTLRNTIMDLCNADFIPFGEKCLARVFLLNIYLGKAIVRLKKRFRLLQDRIS